ncbi:MAG: HNH endonuclease [Nocardioides sp.]|uniref:HNH endonuclease n=1 Tax=Nocardioides sp. TaxID=35761 RepID=UPI0023A4EF5B|nr:HNH endonuclease [Nocardioides sp.]MDE0776546.1 HNH endonuclease [Nocardioides sp.]
MSRFLRFRDRICRTPWCDAPVRHSDHVESAEEGGPTTVANTQGLCETCNHGKQARGWTARPDPGHPARTTGVETTTPTGHRFTSTAPPARKPVWVEVEPGVWDLIA